MSSEVFSIDSSDISINSDTILIDPKVLMIENIPTRKPRNRGTINNICCCFQKIKIDINLVFYIKDPYDEDF